MEHQFNTRWYASDEEADHWISYLHRNLHHVEGEDTPFSDSAWDFSDDDAILHDLVIDTLYQCPGIDASLVKVTVVKGAVYLTGKVNTEVEVRLATKIIQELRDPWSVTNLLEPNERV